MSSDLRLQRLRALRDLSRGLADESQGVFLGICLDSLLEGVPARAALAFARREQLELVAERGLAASSPESTSGLLRALATFAERSLATERPFRSPNLAEDRDGVDDAGELLALGVHSVLALPVLGAPAYPCALVLLFDDPALLDEEAFDHAVTVAHLTALRLQRERRTLTTEEEEEREETARMVSLGLLTATVAHELRGPAGALVLQQEELSRLTSELGQLDGGSDTAIGGAVSELAELSADIGTAILRVRETVDQLSTVSRRELAPEYVDFAQVVEESLSVARPHLERRGVRLTTHFERDCFTLARRDNLAQVVLNLTFNALDACQDVPQPEVWVRVEPAGEHVALFVEDNGPGVPETAIEHIFKPFYTTKPRGLGTGLGLKICSDVVTGHGGHIEVHARRAGGASFRVLLPRTREGSGLITIQVPGLFTPRVAQRPKRVLVVDDDEIFTRTVRRALKPHDVRTAASASEALVLLEDPRYSPDLILCDLFLPGANGNVLHARACARRPELGRRFVFVTGGALGGEEANYLRASGCATLFKPVELKSLLELLEDPNPEAATGSVRTLQQPPPSSDRRNPSSRR